MLTRRALSLSRVCRRAVLGLLVHGLLFRILSAAVIIVWIDLSVRCLLPAASAGIISLHARAAPVHCEFFEYVFKNGRHRLKHTVPLYIYCTRAR